jgi:diguanylate cyclase (GGDEF)-like protein
LNHHDFAPTERFLRRTVLLFLLAAALMGGFATISHLRQVDPHPLDLILPPLLGLIMFGLFVYLYHRPDSILQVVWIYVLTAFAGTAIPAWYYTIEAWRTPGATLIAVLPPVASLLIPPLLILIVFLRPRHLLSIAAVAWLIVAAPILVYLAAHPDELTSPRGLDIVVTLGPITLAVVLFIPLQRSVEHWISKLQSERTKAETLADRDALTGLYNRRAGERLLAEALIAPDPNDVLMLFDLDHFKHINDTYGHPAGDTVLREVAHRCTLFLRKSDVFARWGGEEFLVLIRGTDQTGVIRVANDLRATISATPIEPVEVVTASFGIARFQPGDTMASWLMRSDQALYEAKSAGRDRVVADRFEIGETK